MQALDAGRPLRGWMLQQRAAEVLQIQWLMMPVNVSCADHEGARTARVQQWDGKMWKVISGWYTADEALTEPIVIEVSAKYAAEKKITPRDCSKED